MIIAAALFTGAAVSYAKPQDVYDRLPQAQIPASERFQQGIDAYDKGDLAQAYEIWLPLAQNGDLAAERNVARMLRKGEGVPRDSKRALWFYEDAGTKGFILAMVNAAFMHLEGDGVPVNLEAAAFWFHSAAVSGQPIAAYNLGVLYERGTGVPKDMKKALHWYGKAAKSGSQQAKDRLAVLTAHSADPEKAPPAELQALSATSAPVTEEAEKPKPGKADNGSVNEIVDGKP